MDSAVSVIPRKLIEALFRRFWIALIPVIAVPAAVVVLVHHPVVYESTASVWVSTVAALETSTPPIRSSATDTPAKRQVDVLNDLLATLAFREAVALEAGVVAPDASATDRSGAAYAVGSRIAAIVIGPNLVGVKASAGTPIEAQRIVQAVLNQYQARIAADRARESSVVLGYFEKAVAAAQQDLAQARADTAAYTKLNPLSEKTPTPESLRLADRVENAQKLVDRLVQSQQDALLAAASSTNTSTVTFSVQDAPALPGAPLGIPLLKRLGYPFAALLFGVIIAAAYLYLCYRSDHTIRSREDLVSLDVALLGYVPELKPTAAYARYTPLRWAGFVRRDYARRVAASISPHPVKERAAS